MLASVDKVGVNFAIAREGAHAKKSIFGLKPDIDAFWNVVGDESGNADAKVDDEAVAKFLGGTLSELVAGEGHEPRVDEDEGCGEEWGAA